MVEGGGGYDYARGRGVGGCGGREEGEEGCYEDMVADVIGG